MRGIRYIDLGPGPEHYKLMFKNADLFVVEGQVTRRSAISAIHLARRASVSLIHRIVISSPTLYRLADPIRKQYGRVDAAVHRRSSNSPASRSTAIPP